MPLDRSLPNRFPPPSHSVRFLNGVTDLLGRAVHFSSAFSCVGRENELPYCYLQCDDRSEHVRWARMPHPHKTIAIDGGDLLLASLRAVHGTPICTTKPLPADGRAFVTTDRRLLLVALRSEGVLLGLVGLQRSPDEEPFSDDERREVDSRADAASLAARLYVDWESLACQLAACGTLGRGDGLLLLLDRCTLEVVWANRRGGQVDWTKDVMAIAPTLFARMRELPACGETTVQRFDCTFGSSSIVLAPVDEEYEMGNCAAVRISERISGPFVVLSQREREVAYLLAHGYANLNIASRTGLSENTIRTYIRRLYRKLGVCNRADLLGRLFAQGFDDALLSRLQLAGRPPGLGS